jgi:hypothetical protein
MPNQKNYNELILDLIDKHKLTFSYAVAAVADFNVELKGYPRLIDGTTVTRNYRVLLVGQDDPKENGIYIVNKIWKRERDVDINTKFETGTVFSVSEGNKYKGYCMVVKNVIIGKTDFNMAHFKIDHTLDIPNVFTMNGVLYEKKCYGNYMEPENGCKRHNSCEVQDLCFMHTSITKGPCDCPFKGSCHIPRQEGQEYIRKQSGETVKDCTFYEMIMEEQERLSRI